MAPPGQARRLPLRPRYVLAAVLVAVVFVAALDWVTVESQVTGASGPCTALECGPTMAMGSPQEEGGPGNYSYVLSVTPCCGLTWGGTEFGIQSSAGVTLTPNSAWSIVIVDSETGNGTPVATFGFEDATWWSGSHEIATSGQTIVLRLGPANLHGQGDNLLLSIPSWASSSDPHPTATESLP
jgi:hypothetical protein